MQDGEDDLRDDMLGSDQVNIVNISYILQLDVPFAKLLRGEIESVALMCDVVVLAEDAAKVAA
jgi:hypothetical protein